MIQLAMHLARLIWVGLGQTAVDEDRWAGKR